MNAVAFLAPTPLSPPSKLSSVQCCSRHSLNRNTTRSSAAPPEGRIHQNFPQRSRFRAPHIRFTTTDQELYNRVDCSNAKVELNTNWARQVLKQAQSGADGAHRVLNSKGDFRALFSGEADRGDTESDVVEKWFPKSRRYEVPVIDIMKDDAEARQGDEDEEKMPGYKLRIDVESVGDVDEVEKERASESTEEENEAVEYRKGEFWKKTPATPGLKARTNTTEVVNRCFPRTYRNLAPVISFAKGELGVSLSMNKVEGGPKKEDYEQFFSDDKAFRGPQIRLQAPQGAWDEVSGFVEVSNEEVQLPVVRGANLKQQLVEAK